MSDAPEIDASDFEGPAILATELLDRQAAGRLPVWVKAGRTRSRVTPQNVDGVRKGLLIASDLVSHWPDP